ncbi:MAG: hypothetical protein AABM29_01390 [Actinomycetota bacterium]
MPLTRTGLIVSELKDLRSEMKDLRAETKLESARNREEAERGREALRRIEVEFEKNREVYGHLETFTTQLSERNERIHRELIREMRDLRDDARAQREGFLNLIDRLFPPSDPDQN